MMDNMEYMEAMKEKKDYVGIIHKKLWNEDCENKRERLKYWNKFDQYFRKGIDLIVCKNEDMESFCEYLREHNYEV